MIQKLETNEFICEPISDLELLERNPLKNPEKGDTFFCHPKNGQIYKLIVLKTYFNRSGNMVKIVKNGDIFQFSYEEYRFVLLSIPSNYIVFSKTV